MGAMPACYDTPYRPSIAIKLQITQAATRIANFINPNFRNFMNPPKSSHSSLHAAVRRLCSLTAVVASTFVAGASIEAHAAAPYDLIPLNANSPNFTHVFSNVKIGDDTVVSPSNFKDGAEMLSAVYAYLNPNSPVHNNTAYRDRLFVLLDHYLGAWAGGKQLGDIGFAWQASYAYMLMKHHRPGEISSARRTTYEAGINKENANALAGKSLVYTKSLLADLWLNGDIRLAKGVYFGALAVGDNAKANTAKAAIDGVMSKAVLGDGATRYVGFWGETPSYHNETIKNYIYWWKITGSPTIKTALDKSLHYSTMVNEPSGFVEQSTSIPYKHMYNNIMSESSALWKAYIYNDGYNYFYGKEMETATSNELLNTILYQPNRITKTPSSNVGVMFDRNIQGPRGRFNGNWGWVAHGRDVQGGGPEEVAFSDAQGYEGHHGGKSTFVGGYALGAEVNKTSLKGALDSVTVEFKRDAEVETDVSRGDHYRFLAQDEETDLITRKNFGTISTTYRISSRTSAPATPNWDASRTKWNGHQLWTLTGERMIGIVQIENDEADTVYGLDARLVFTGGRKDIMGAYLPLTRPDATSFDFGELRAKIHGSTFAGPVTQQRVAIYENHLDSKDDYSALVRINDATTKTNTATTHPAGTRRWMMVDIHRDAVADAASVINVLPDSPYFAVLQFNEGTRKVRIVQNLTNTPRAYSGNFVCGNTYNKTSLHRSWSNTVSPLAVVSNVAKVAETIPAYGHMIAVSSNQGDDHNNGYRTYQQAYP
jgi:hypothetical protein